MVLTPSLASTDQAPSVPPKHLDIEGRMGPLTRLADGRLLSVYGEGRPEQKWDYLSIPQRVFGRYSEDDGEHWSEPRLLFPMPEGPGAAAVAVTSGGALPFTDRSGAVHLFGCRYYQMPAATEENPPTIRAEDFFKARTELWHTVSRDGGKNWEPVRNLDYGHRYTGALNSVIQLTSGRIVLPFSYLHADRRRGFFVSTAIYSDDGGRTWVHSRNDVTLDSGGTAIESGAVEPHRGTCLCGWG